MLAEIIKAVAPFLVTALASLLGWALVKLSAYLHAKASESKVLGAMAVASDFVSACVAHASEKLEPDLKAALAKGSISPEDRAKIIADALALVKSQLPAGIAGTLAGALGDGLETWLSGKVVAAHP